MSDRVVLITGGAGHIGQAMAFTLAELGASLLLLDIDDARLKKCASRITDEYGVTVNYLTIDLEDNSQVASVPEHVKALYGRLDVLINNAAFVGVSNLDGWSVEFCDQSLNTWRRAFEVNLTSVFSLVQGCRDMLEATGNGVIINVASIYGEYGPDLRLYAGTSMNNPAAYAVSKGGLIQFTRWLSTVLAPKIRVNAISPGGVFRNQPETFVSRYIDKTPLRRMASEDDFKGVVAFLASEMSSYVTGQNILVDGGWSVW